MAVDINAFKNITSATTTLVYTGACTLQYLTVNKAVASQTVTIYDGIDATGTVVGTVAMPATLTENNYTLEYEVALTTGLAIVTSGSTDITACWRPN